MTKESNDTSRKKLQVECALKLAGTDCEACGGKKKRAKSFCWTCFHLLPGWMRGRLYRKIGHGYCRAYLAAVKYLADVDRGTDIATQP